MTIARFKYAAVAVACLAGASAQADTLLLGEGFESFGSLAGDGWVLLNESAPIGTTSLAPGDANIFAAQAGSPDSYVSGNYNNADVGGTISSWLITPQFSTTNDVTVTFWARADIFDTYFDQIQFGFSGGSSDTPSFTMTPAVTLTGNWTQFSATFAAQGAGSVARFAVAYVGSADNANFIGVDSVSVTAVPEPSAWMMFAGGLLGVAGVARRRLGAPR